MREIQMFKRFLLSVCAAVALFLAAPAAAQNAQKCDGPEELCAQVVELQDALKRQEEARQAAEDESDEKVRQARAEEERRKEARMKKVIAAAAVLAVALRMLLSLLASWKDYFKTDRGKAWLKLSTIVIGLLAFIAGNMGFGLPWWQALILAGGGPASMAVHSVIRLIPVLRGKAKYVESDPPPPPDPATPA